MTTTLIVLITLGVGLIATSFFEWWLHKYLLHRPHKFFNIWFKNHTRVHHVKFKFDESYHLQNPEDADIIDMKRWAPVLIISGSLPYLLFILLFEFQQEWVVLVTGTILSIAYYSAYEYLHWCMHLPKARRVEMSRLFQRLNGHHLLHHRFMGKNYNVVFPFADWWMRTLLLRSTIQFKQPRGPAVPDVQPLT